MSLRSSMAITRDWDNLELTCSVAMKAAFCAHFPLTVFLEFNIIIHNLYLFNIVLNK